MQLNRWNYYSGFVVYPAVILILSALALRAAPDVEWWRCASLLVVGVIAWTLAEYCLHRFVLHHVARIRDLHEAHHRDPQALIGLPTVVGAPVSFILLFAPLWWIGGVALACSLTAGFLLGYAWYLVVHHLLHHRPARKGSLFFALKRRHALHHHVTAEGNFGVTSGIWDRLFRTDIQTHRNAARKRAGTKLVAQ